MNLEDYEDKDGKKVWLSSNEVEALLATDEVQGDTRKRVAVGLGAFCGLRSDEAVRVAPEDVVDTDAGRMLRVWESAKTGSYRETPIPSDLATTIRTVGDVRDEPGERVVDVSTRTVRRWVQDARDELVEARGDPGWRYLGYHDLRRTWATQLRSEDVDAMVVCDWGGWSDLETFLEHYRGTSTPEAQRRERDKVDWL